MKKKRQQNWRQRLRSWFQKNSIDELKYLAKNSWKECPHRKYGIMQ